MAADDDTTWFKIGISYRCHWVADAKLAVGDQKFIKYPTDANNGTR